MTRAESQDLVRRILPFWLCGLVLGSMLPGKTKLRLHTTGLRQTHTLSPDVTLGHHIYHYFFFGCTTSLLLFVAERRRPAQWKAVLFVVVLGVSIEIAQHLVYGNMIEWWDMRDDALAALCAFAGWRLGEFALSLW